MKKETPLHKKLSSELIELIPQLDEEGLSFLIEQAKVHLYNLEIGRQEMEIETNQKNNQNKPKQGNTQENAQAHFRIERSGDGNNYHLITGGKWKLFNEEEMLAMVKIAQGPDSSEEIASRLHLWLMKERPDTFGDLEIGDERDPKMKELVMFLKKSLP